jgi:hypothetical protein
MKSWENGEREGRKERGENCISLCLSLLKDPQ